MRPVTKIVVMFLVVATLCVMSFGTLAAWAATGTANVIPGVVDGSSYAGYLKIPAGFSQVSVGPLFPASLGLCNTSAKQSSSSAASLNLRGIANTGTLVDNVESSLTPTTTTVQASADVQQISILAGLITASEVKAAVVSNATTSSASSANTSVFTNLAIAGIPISATPAPNTIITLPGLGVVVLNEQNGPVNHADHTSISVTAIDVQVTLLNIFGLPVGAHILIAHAQSQFTRTGIPDVVSAKAYGLYAFVKAVSPFVASGPWATATIACSGGNKTVSVNSISVPVIGSIGTLTDTAVGSLKSSGAHAHSSSTVQQLNLLSGTITADAITASSQVQFTSTGSASGQTQLVNAFVAGVLISANPPPNTRINIANLGYVIINEQQISVTSTGASIIVNAFDLHVTTANALGLPVGVRIIISHSESNAHTDKS